MVEAAMPLRWAISPCPNDTFIFGALATGCVPCDLPLSAPKLLDIDALNRLAKSGEMDFIKVSAAAYPELAEGYQVLPVGGAMGRGVGPLVVAREDFTDALSPDSTVAIPGEKTTAAALFRHFYPELTCMSEFLFSEIEPAVQKGEADLGLLIHEGRFTYRQYNLRQVQDLGQKWEEKYDCPLPLGIILVKRTLPEQAKRAIGEAIARSLRYAWQNPQGVKPFVEAHAQEMNPEVQRQHIELYVNDFSLNLREEGQRALQTLWSIAHLEKAIPADAFSAP